MRSYDEILQKIDESANPGKKLFPYTTQPKSVYRRDEDYVSEISDTWRGFMGKCKGVHRSKFKRIIRDTTITGSRLLRPEKVKLSVFSGNIRKFARFRRDFEKIVVPGPRSSSLRNQRKLFKRRYQNSRGKCRKY